MDVWTLVKHKISSWKYGIWSCNIIVIQYIDELHFKDTPSDNW